MKDKRPGLNVHVRKQLKSKGLMDHLEKSRGKVVSKNDTLLKNYPLKKILFASKDLQDSSLKRDFGEGEGFPHDQLKSTDHFHTFKPLKKSKSKKRAPKKSTQTKLPKGEKEETRTAKSKSRVPQPRRQEILFKKEKSTGCLKKKEGGPKIQMLSKKKKSKSCKKIAQQKELSSSQTKL